MADEPLKLGKRIFDRKPPAMFAHGLLAYSDLRSCGGESWKHSLRDSWDDDPERPSVPSLKENRSSGCDRVGMEVVELLLAPLVREGLRKFNLRRFLREGQLRCICEVHSHD